MDFTFTKYKQLLETLKSNGFLFQTFEQFLIAPSEKVVILRHDVDLRPQNSLTTAIIENELGIVGSYYFRIVKNSNNPEIIKQIIALGHEIGYHYETMDTINEKLKVKSDKLINLAYEEFCKNLEYFRTLYPVKTICMHGSPLSRYDNKDIWKKYDYKKLGLIGEPYFDVDFSKVLYLTDTGRRWNGERVSIRDKVQKSFNNSVNPQLSTFNYTFRHTKDIINAAEKGLLPNQIMITVHPQRWNSSPLPWTKELVIQNIKNIVKWGLIKVRK